MARVKKMTSVSQESRLNQLKNLAKILAKQIDKCSSREDGSKHMPQLSKQYRETIKEIEGIEGAEADDDEIGKILSARRADGLSDSVR